MRAVPVFSPRLSSLRVLAIFVMVVKLIDQATEVAAMENDKMHMVVRHRC